MSFIYKITNLIDNKVYIGLTTRTVEARWKEHCRHGSQQIDDAIQLYGIENFQIETLEECDESILDDREKYWIDYYDSFKNGYNNTYGGRGNNFIMTDKSDIVLQLWEDGLTINRIVEKTSLNVETVRSYLNKQGITKEQIKERANQILKELKSIKIKQYDLNGNFIKEWNSSVEAEKDLNINSRSIRAVCSGKRNTAGGFIWKYLNDNSPVKLKNKTKKKVCQYDLNNNYIATYHSLKEAEEQTGINYTSISKACNNRIKTAGKYIWKYKGDELDD